MASYRYRCETPAKLTGSEINNPDCDVLVYSKPMPCEFVEGKKSIVDFCDDHFDRFPHYKQFLHDADLVTCPTEVMRERIKSLGRDAEVIPETWEFDQLEPHCSGNNLLWFGHAVNLKSLSRFVLPNLHVVSNAPGTIPWSHQAMLREFSRADIVIIPRTSAYKSPNRAVESIRQGCFVVAEPHPALREFPIWQGDIQEGIQWASKHPDQANNLTRQAQRFLLSRYSPKTVGDAWNRALGSI